MMKAFVLEEAAAPLPCKLRCVGVTVLSLITASVLPPVSERRENLTHRSVKVLGIDEKVSTPDDPVPVTDAILVNVLGTFHPV
jgi:hypothetical protein